VPRHLKSYDLRLVISTLYRVVRDATTMKDDDIIQIELRELDSTMMRKSTKTKNELKSISSILL
jgi:hypothetical protein